MGYFVNFLVIFGYIWEEIIFLKGLVKYRKIGNIEDLMKVYKSFSARAFTICIKSLFLFFFDDETK